MMSPMKIIPFKVYINNDNIPCSINNASSTNTDRATIRRNRHSEFTNTSW